MIVGAPAETKEGEHRVALTPDGVRELVAHGQRVRIEAGAGEGSSIHDHEYKAAGADVVDLGAGNVGWNAAWIAQGMESEVVLLDRNVDRLRWVDQIHKGRILTLASNRGAVERAVLEADLLIGAVLVAGGRAPLIVTEDMVRSMKPGSV